MHEALDRDPDPVAALRRFVTNLTPKEKAALRDLLDDPGTGGSHDRASLCS